MLLYITLIKPHLSTIHGLFSASQEGCSRVKAGTENTNQNDQAAAWQKKTWALCDGQEKAKKSNSLILQNNEGNT